MNARNLITMAEMVETGVTHAVATGVIWEAYHDWKHMPKVEPNWNRWKSHFNDAFNELKELNAITTYSLGYGMHNINECNFASNVTAANDNLASAAISKMDATKLILQSNKYLAEMTITLTKENEELLALIK